MNAELETRWATAVKVAKHGGAGVFVDPQQRPRAPGVLVNCEALLAVDEELMNLRAAKTRLRLEEEAPVTAAAEMRSKILMAEAISMADELRTRIARLIENFEARTGLEVKATFDIEL